jgi:hypothetical protein
MVCFQHFKARRTYRISINDCITYYIHVEKQLCNFKLEVNEEINCSAVTDCFVPVYECPDQG